MIFTSWINNWHNDYSTLDLSPLKIFDGKSLEDLWPATDPVPVEPGGGIGDGAGPIPIPVESDGGIGDGAGPIPNAFANRITGGGTGTDDNDHFLATDQAETFIFESGKGNDAISGFDLDNDTLDLSKTGFTNINDLMATAADAGSLDYVIPAFSKLAEGIIIKTGDGAYGYMEGITVNDLGAMNITFG